MQHAYGIFEEEADHIIEMVRQHASLAQVLSAKCPACGATLIINFSDDGNGFSILCEGKPLHFMTHQDIANPPPWWRECVVEPTNVTWYWRTDHSFDSSGDLSMHMSGWQDGEVWWSGEFTCPTDHPDHMFWLWVLSESGCTSDLIDDSELADLRARFARISN